MDGWIILQLRNKEKWGKEQEIFLTSIIFYRKYLKRDGSVNYLQTFFCYSICEMPLCKENRIDLVAGRTITCSKEHVNFDETHLWYNDFIHCRNFIIDKMIKSYPRRSSKKRNKRQWACLCQCFFVICSHY